MLFEDASATIKAIELFATHFTLFQGPLMPKAYWISTYQTITDPAALAAYAALAGPALQAAGGRFLARGMPAKIYEAAVQQRSVLLEFESVAHATEAHDSPAYQEALRALGKGAVRDIRIIEAIE